MKPLEPGIPSIQQINRQSLFARPLHLVYADEELRTLILKSLPISQSSGILATQVLDRNREVNIHSYVINEAGNFLEKNQDWVFHPVNFPYDYFYMLITQSEEVEWWRRQPHSHEQISNHFRDIWISTPHQIPIDKAMQHVLQAYVGLLQK
jgi:hypothetical protein